MADWNTITILGRLLNVAKSKSLPDNGEIYSFNLEYREGKNVTSFMVVTNLTYLINQTIKPYLTVEENIGKRLVVIGSISADKNVIYPSRIQFIDSIISAETALKAKKNKIDFSDD